MKKTLKFTRVEDTDHVEGRFYFFNKKFQSYTSLSASHCTYFPPYCFTMVLKKCWPCTLLYTKRGRHEIIEPTTISVTEEQMKLNNHLLRTYYKHITLSYLGCKTTLKIDRIMLIIQMNNFDVITISILNMTMF